MATCGNCGAGVEMDKVRLEWKTDQGTVVMLRGLMAICEACGARSLDPETVDRLENAGVVTSAVTQ